MKKITLKNQKINCGNFIAFEGINGSRKSAQIVALLTNWLNKEGIYCYTILEPIKPSIGLLIHQIITGRVKTDNRSIAGLFVADCLDHLLNKVNEIVPKINQGTTGITDRYYFFLCLSYRRHAYEMGCQDQ